MPADLRLFKAIKLLMGAPETPVSPSHITHCRPCTPSDFVVDKVRIVLYNNAWLLALTLNSACVPVVGETLLDLADCPLEGDYVTCQQCSREPPKLCGSRYWPFPLG